MAETAGQTVPKGRVVSVRFEFAMPADATREQVDEWIAYVNAAVS